jgi:GNAT superfamily N-acetyltransferase
MLSATTTQPSAAQWLVAQHQTPRGHHHHMATDDPAVAIRTAAPTDDEAVVDLLHSYVAEANPQLLALTGRTIVPTDREEVRRWVAASRAERATILLAIHRGGSPIGTGTLRQLPPGVAEIKRIYVSPDHRGRGVGAQLLDALVDDGRRRGVGLIQLDSAPFQRGAHALYLDRGFTARGPYSGSETPPELIHTWHFFELNLT